MKKPSLYVAALIFLAFAATGAQEKYSLTTPQVQPSVSDYTLQVVHLDWSGKVAYVEWLDSVGVSHVYTWTELTSTKASTLMIALNKANLSTSSLQKRIFLQLQADGQIPAGSVTGTPQ